MTKEESIAEFGILHQFVGTYRWEFEEDTICCTAVYGGVLLPGKQQDQGSSVAAANAKLRRRLEEIQRRGIEIDGADRRFENSECLCGRT